MLSYRKVIAQVNVDQIAQDVADVYSEHPF